MSESKKVFVLTGIPGSGKSTWCKNVAQGIAESRSLDLVVCSADHYHLKYDESLGLPRDDPRSVTYQFNPKKIGIAHMLCRRKFIKAIQEDDGIVVVDNTNLRERERYEYIELALMKGWSVEVIHFVCLSIKDVRRCVLNQVHNVPLETIGRMALNHETYPHEYGEGVCTSYFSPHSDGKPLTVEEMSELNRNNNLASQMHLMGIE